MIPYDRETCVSAGALRSRGVTVPRDVPDHAWIPKKDVELVERREPGDDGETRYSLDVTFHAAFAWDRGAMIRFAALTPSLAQPGGAERTILIQLRYADPARLRCAGIALAGFGALDEDLGRELGRYTSIHGDPPHHGRRPAVGRAVTHHRDLAEAVRHVCREADVLIVWGSLTMGQYTAGLGIPVVCVSHISGASGTEISGITHLVAVSEAARRFWSEAPAAAGLPVAVIPNGVEVDRACPRRGRAWQRAQWGVGPDDRVLLYLGRQAPDKNPWASIQALARLPEYHRLVLVGNQSFDNDQPLPRLVAAAAELGVADRVTFLPPVPFVGDVLAGADCLLHLSLREADSLVVKEAFLAGLPVVHTPVGSIPEMEAEFGQVGWGVGFRPGPSGPGSVDPDEVAHQVRMALGDGGTAAAAVAAEMRAVAWERWTGPAMCDRWATYLEEVVGSWRR